MDGPLPTSPVALSPARVRDALAGAGIDAMSGVPCSLLTPLIDLATSDPGMRYLPATSEGEAVGIAAGAWLAGRRPAVILQNSGLGNAVNPITSLNHPFRIPLLMLVTWRGEPGLKDEPQHMVMGAITPDLLDLMQVSRRLLEAAPEALDRTVAAAVADAERRGLPAALLIRKGVVAGEGEAAACAPGPGPSRSVDRRRNGRPIPRIAALEALLGALPDEAGVIATTGKSGRELFTLRDREQHLYLVGSMGLASAVGLGAAHYGRRPVVVVDGDGAALMKLGNMATIGAARPERLVHVILDNGVHDSTGGQPTVSGVVDLARVAAACGYASAQSCDEAGGLVEAVRDALASPGPHCLHVRIAPGSIAGVARPTVAPEDVARRFRRFLTS